jgi:hypothetical protein
MASLNPFKAIEELINEHGSAVIQGKHIAFLKEQLSILKEQFFLSEKRLGEALSRITQLEAENQKLKSKTQQSPGVGMGAAPILGALFERGPALGIDAICEFSKIDRDEVEHIFIGQLADSGFIGVSRDVGGAVLTAEILPAGKTAWVHHRKLMELYE